MTAIELVNRAISESAINVYNEHYKVIMGDIDFVPETIIIDSEDYNCGALCNELEFARTVAFSYVQSLDINTAEGYELELLARSFIDLLRYDYYETDEDFVNRFKAITIQSSYPHRTTPWSIIAALEYFFPDTKVTVKEDASYKQYFFQVRIGGVFSSEDVDTLYFDQGYFDNEFLGGIGVGKVLTYVSKIIERIRAAGVEHEIIIVQTSSITTNSNADIGSTRISVMSDAVIQ
jgi:hypothetical protein